MMSLEERLFAELQQQADRVPAESGDLRRVRRVGRRRLLVSRVASLAGMATVAFVVVAAVVMLQGPANQTNMASAGVKGGYALSPYETATMTVDCLQQRGLDVTQSGNAIEYDNRVVSDNQFEAGVAGCQTKLRQSGFLLPGDNPEYLEVLYVQYQAFAECYREAGIEISLAPGLDTFIEARQGGGSAWSPQSEAIREVGADEAARAESDCAIPTRGQVTSDD